MRDRHIISNQKINIIYSNDYNIIDLQTKIVNILKIEQNNKINELETKINQIRKHITTTLFDGRKRILLKDMIELETRLEKIKNSYLNFSNETADLIKNYRELGTATKRLVFGSSDDNRSIVENSEKSDYRQLLILKFLNIAKKYINLNINHNREINLKCSDCGFLLQDEDCGAKIKDSEIACVNCGLIYHVFIQSDICEVSSSEYQECMNFNREIIRFEGKEKTTIPDKLFTALDEYFKSVGLPTGEEIKKMPLIPAAPTRESRRGAKIIGKKILRKALHDTGFNAYYENINLITHLFWGWELPSISHLVDKLMEHYTITQTIYQQIKGKKKASLNNSWRLKQHLIILGFKILDDDFNVSEDNNILDYYNQTWKKLVELSNNPEIKYIPS